MSAHSNLDSFQLYGADFRPGNILINDANEVVSFDSVRTYNAPKQFALDPPWWLLIDTPEMWDAGIDDWVKKNKELRFETWLSAMTEAEMTSAELKSTEYPLSVYMRESWAFDTVFWKYLHDRSLGRRENCVERTRVGKQVCIFKVTVRGMRRSHPQSGRQKR